MLDYLQYKNTISMSLSNIDLTNPHWEIRYPLIGTSLPTDHGYCLYSAISHKIPTAHEQANWSMATIGGKPNGQREILSIELAWQD